MPYLLLSIIALLPFWVLRIILFVIAGVYQAIIVNRQYGLVAGNTESISGKIARMILIIIACFILSFGLSQAYGEATSTKAVIPIDIITNSI